ncbi:uncharacterized protein LOC132536911 [Erinaceus europaeus]|uniref:Uncharacterized protein LOC132536911 n=1 Tax=Erinaceus europaeus TaxID=9365 RepID=A0ABM3X0M2_ERIEU|nr:uncharacterized protein LOC132536911 [Erinaceus europaeus]
MSVSTRKSSRLSGFLGWLPCLRNSPADEDIPQEETPWEGSCGMQVLDGLAKFKIGRRRQARQIYLCTNVLLISNSKFKSKFKIDHFVPLHTMWVSDCLGKSGRANSRARRSLVLGWSSINFVVSFFSVRRKEEWFYFLHRYIMLAKSKAQPENTLQDTVSEDVENCACDPEKDDQVPMKPVKNETPDAMKGVFTEDEATWTTFRSIIRNPKKQGLLVAMNQEISIKAKMENIWQCAIYNHLCKAPRALLEPTLLFLSAPQCTLKSERGSGDKVTHKVPLHNNYALGHPIFPVHLAVEDMMDYVNLVLQKKKVITIKFSPTVA